MIYKYIRSRQQPTPSNRRAKAERVVKAYSDNKLIITYYVLILDCKPPTGLTDCKSTDNIEHKLWFSIQVIFLQAGGNWKVKCTRMHTWYDVSKH